MNLILFESKELDAPLPPGDSRVVHVLEILKLGPGDEFAAGVIGGPTGRARLGDFGPEGFAWSFDADPDQTEPTELHPLVLVLGCPRPPVARRLLKDMSAMGLQEIRACRTDLNEGSYVTSRLWRDGLWRRALIDGAMQGVSTRLPAVRTDRSLESALGGLPAGRGILRIALDTGPGTVPMENSPLAGDRIVLAVGPERGWSDRERRILDDQGFRRERLGRRVLRTETACAVGAGILLHRIGAI